ncbi:hypothetical protein ATCC90586_009739 [Pythium insidiosum]|nr:hypothetical protein ATCC90586_009739 [Pythium insidiosum]
MAPGVGHGGASGHVRFALSEEGNLKARNGAQTSDADVVNGLGMQLFAGKQSVAGTEAGRAGGQQLMGAGGATAKASAEHFARSVALMSVAHIARGVGFDAIQRSAGDALVELLAKYIQRLGVAAKETAEHAGRTQARASDVALALHDMLPAPVELRDLIKALETAKRPFPRDVPSFPVKKRDHVASQAMEQSKIGVRAELPPYVPKFLPPLPNRHTYSADSHVVVDRERDPKRSRLDLLDQKSQVQQSLHGLQAAFGQVATAVVPQQSWNAFQGASVGAGESAAASNPFVQPAVSRGSAAAQGSRSKKAVFGGLDRGFAPTLARDKGAKKNAIETSSVNLSKLSSNQELGKEDKILNGTFHDGDSE